MDQDQHTSIDDQQFVTNTYDDITGGTNTDGFVASISDKREVVTHSLELSHQQ